MSKFMLPATFALALVATSCGGASDPPRMLLSIQITPATADGQAQFIATGTFSDGTTAPISAMWTLNPPFSLTPATPIPGGVNLNSTGLGKCTGFTGNAAIFATAPADPRIPIAKMTVKTKNVSGTAQLACP